MVPYIATFLKKIFVGGVCHQLSKPVLDKVLYVVIVASKIGTYPQWGLGALYGIIYADEIICSNQL